MTVTAIFLPGLYGSTLHAAPDDALRWPSLAEILWRRRSLALRGNSSLRAGRVVHRVDVIPGLYAIDVYGEALARLRQLAGAHAQWREFAYDWRADVSTQLQQLDAVVDEERARGRRVVLVCHSLGGLLAGYYLRYGTQPLEQARETWSGAAKIDGVVLAGAPFGGSVLALIDLVEGRRILGNGRILDAATYRSFGATWQLLPSSSGAVIDTRGAVVPADLSDPQEWRRLGLVSDSDEASRSLRSARDLRRLLTQPSAHAPPQRLPMLVIQGVNRPTLARVVRHSSARGTQLIDNAKQWRKIAAGPVDASVLFSDGDSVVTRLDSAAPACWHDAMAVETLEVRRSHRRLLNDNIVQERIAQLIAAVAG